MTYTTEVANLDAVWAASRESLSDETVRRVVDILRGRAVIAMGSGGTLAAAELLAQLHISSSNQSALVSTPLEFVEMCEHVRAHVLVVFSARAKHPDTALAIKTALALEMPVVLISAKGRQDLGELSDPRVEVVTVGYTEVDGFLATGSLLSMCLAIAQIYGVEIASSLPVVQPLTNLRRRLLVLYSWRTKPAARDLETRLHELGLADVQLSDFRNFAHGRHVGLALRMESTTVLALVDPAISRLAEKTIAAIPATADIRVVETHANGAAASIESLVRVIAAPIAFDAVGDPAKPRVPEFGRKLYHLPYRSMFKRKPMSPALLKAVASGSTAEANIMRFEAAFATWRRATRRVSLGGLMLDWDGTCVETADRWHPPAPDVQESLTRALDLGLQLTFATGRGDSLWRELRTWLPQESWPAVHLELHNGAWFQPLAEDLGEADVHLGDWAERLLAALAPLVEQRQLAVRRSSTQISIRPVELGLQIEDIFRTVLTLIADEPAVAAMSGHSVDVIDSVHGKQHALARAVERCGAVLAVGDQGALGGNDFAMLNATALSISVDRMSDSEDRCWRLDSGARGPAGLVLVLDRLSRARDGVRLHL